MEKFNRWSDPATGINPFVPVNRNHRLSFIAKVFSFFGGILLLLIRIPILICVGFAHFILSACFERIPVNAIRRLLLRFVDVVFIGTILFLLGLREIAPSNWHKIWASMSCPELYKLLSWKRPQKMEP